MTRPGMSRSPRCCPAPAGSLVLVTSRRHLTALEDAAAISLDTLAPGEAAALLARLAGRPGLGSGDGPAGEITRLCGYLPLAIGMLARQLHHHPAWTAADLAAELAAAAGRLELMRAENLSVAAAFDLSYQDLTDGQQRLFRRLGVHPGSDIDAYAAAALDGTDLAAARRHLDGLYDQYLLTEPARGRYRLHDLLARARPRAGVRRRPGRRRRRGRAAAGLLPAHRRGGRPHIATRNTVVGPAAARRTAGRRPAAVHGRAGVGLAGRRAGEPARGRRLRRRQRAARACHRHPRRDQRLPVRPGSLGSVRRRCTGPPWPPRGQAGDRAGQAGALNELGILQRATGDHPAAAASRPQALELYRGLGDRLGQASALDNLGRVQYETGDYPAAAASHQQALALYRDLGHRVGQALAINNLGIVQSLTADYPAAAASHQQALGMFRDLGHRLGQALATGNLGTVQSRTGDYPAAAASYQQALGMFRDLGDRLGQAMALHNLGEVQLRTGDYPAAAATQQQALGMFRDLGHRLGQALATGNLGTVQLRTGDYPAAAASLTKALGIYRDLGDRYGQAEVLNDLGDLLARSGGRPPGPRPPRPGTGHRPRDQRAAGGSTRPGRPRPLPAPGRRPRRRRRALAAGPDDLPAHRRPGRPADPGNPAPARHHDCPAAQR